jgi:hypothetical protein
MLFKGLVKLRRRRNKENVVNFANDVGIMYEVSEDVKVKFIERI